MPPRWQIFEQIYPGSPDHERIGAAEFRDRESNAPLASQQYGRVQPLRHTGDDGPMRFSKKGLPIGLQLVGPVFREPVVLSIAYAYQQSTDWHRRTPSIVAFLRFPRKPCSFEDAVFLKR
jgi:hypothetical protein